jgi:hypothetical protein
MIVLFIVWFPNKVNEDKPLAAKQVQRPQFRRFVSVHVHVIASDASEGQKGADFLLSQFWSWILTLRNFASKSTAYRWKWQPVGESNPSYQVENLVS